MNKIQQLSGIITKICDLSPTAREYTITTDQPFSFVAGAFVNVFIEHEGKTIRRAFSMSSSDSDSHSFTISIRLNLKGELTPILWEKDFTGHTVKLMGPLGLNTADKMSADKVFLFGFGVGAGVVKSLADHFSKRDNLVSLTIMTGNRTNDEILHKDYFDALTQSNHKVSVQYIVSDKNQSLFPIGYIQEHVGGLNFNNSDVYMCGQSVACQALEATVKASNPENCRLFIEDFH